MVSLHPPNFSIHQLVGAELGRLTNAGSHRTLPQLNWIHPSSSTTRIKAQNPVRLLRSNEVRSKAGKWFSVDGMSTGLIFLFLRGVRLHKADRPGGPVPVQIEFSEWNEESLFQTLGPSGGNLRDGICGAPIVEDEGIGGVLGFFQLGSVEWCLSPVLDEIIDRGWAVL